MAGTREGGLKAAQSNKRLYGANFYNVIGGTGGRKSKGGGFAWMKENDPDRLKEIGHRGGSNSKRPKSRQK